MKLTADRRNGNPRVRRSEFDPWVGKAVTIGTREFHVVSGRVLALHATGFRGSVFVVDDNFIGNKVEVRRLLGPLAAWMRERGFPFELYTEVCPDAVSSLTR